MKFMYNACISERVSNLCFLLRASSVKIDLLNLYDIPSSVYLNSVRYVASLIYLVYCILIQQGIMLGCNFCTV